ncbi:MAG: hypothetical protein OHK0039_04220 [Bacteroidia bacterium]
MINMMYLVLLALLALNVSAEILEAFENIRRKLEASALQALETNNQFIDRMMKEIDEEIANEGKRTNEKLKDTLETVKNETAGLIGLIDKYVLVIQDSIIQVDPETGKLLKKDETEANLQYWLGQGKQQEVDNGRGSGQARVLRDRIDAYNKFVTDLYNSQLKDAANHIKLAPLKDVEEALDGQRKSWERYTFEGPAIANIATLEALKLDIYEQEKQLLNLLNERLGVATFKADTVLALEAPVSSIVPAGLQYETRLFVAMTSTSMKPTYSASGGSVKVDPSGSFATLTIPASGSVIPSSKSEGRQAYSAVIKVPKATGGTQDLQVKGEFTVRRPEIVVTSAAVQILYENCGNDVNIDVPALGDFYNPRITATGGTVTPLQGKKTFRIVPTGRSTTVTVNSITNGQTLKIGDLTYKVIKPPKPEIRMLVNGKAYNGASMVPKTSRVQVGLSPDDDFKSALPNDAKYGIGSIDVLAQLSLGPPTKVNAEGGSRDAVNNPINVSLGTQVRQQARPGTKVYIRINDIYRINFEGKTVPDNRFSEIERMLSLVVQ